MSFGLGVLYDSSLMALVLEDLLDEEPGRADCRQQCSVLKMKMGQERG